jgi:hypothetical protein
VSESDQNKDCNRNLPVNLDFLLVLLNFLLIDLNLLLVNLSLLLVDDL